MIKMFKEGIINTLIATCVAEEGLDIGDVNLIISYDCLSSPIRMI
jgi:ERCC4-related helicase